MPRREDIKKILLIGSGPIVIGQACEFDYSGTQGAKALERQLNGAQSGAFLIARDISGDPGFQARRGASMGVRRDLGFAGVTISAEQGRVWQEVETSATGQRINSSMRRTYLIARAGKSAQLRAPRVEPGQPSISS